jgi:hypothetical protein
MRLIPWATGLVLALPVLVAHYPPMADIPLHEAVVGLLRHWGDSSYVPPNVYVLNLGQPNQLFYFLILGAALAFHVSVTAAMKLVVAATLLLMPVAAAHLADHLGVTRWTAVLVAPLALGWMFFWGLLANLQGFDAYFFALPALDRLCEKPTPRRALAACGWMVLLHFTHDQLALTAAGTLVLFSLCARTHGRVDAMRLFPAALATALVLAARHETLSLYDSGGATHPAFAWDSIGHKFASVPTVLFAAYEPWVRLVVFGVCALPIGLFVAENVRANHDRRGGWREQLHARRFEVLGTAFVVSYFASPASMQSTTLIYQRFLPLAWTVFAVALGPPAAPARLSGLSRLSRLAASVVPLVPLLTSWPAFVESSTVYRDLDACIARMDRGSTYAVIELGPMRDYEMYRPVSGVGHVVAVLGGRGLADFSHSPAAPVFKKVQWEEEVARLAADSYHFFPEYDLTRFKYAILHSPDATIMAVGALAMEPDARVVFQQGEWTVMESTHLRVPIDAPDQPLPVSRGKTLGTRARLVAEAMRASPSGASPSRASPSGG